MSLNAASGPDVTGSAPARRRRGAELETALLEAAWAELVEKGYDALTYEGVAARAGTSRAVVYRRWPSKPDLVRAVVVHGARAETYEPIDTGSLRGDLLALLTWANRARVRVGLTAFHRLTGYFAETGTALSDLREVFVGGREPSTEAFYRRAVARGEVKEENLTPRARSLAFDLMRGELLMTLRPVSPEVIEEIVDDVVMPLLTR
ncbi:TetR/AcrR family transcriptional regulator [Xylanimonas protaetiae]|uniref:TetR/AcrR family transcriptional regulator n=1 Tax=Xylanimonas protaetiae TaxID=2509457 RepID=A0A4V0YGH1_9MICO|nr:TetR/AcrR family transcriptional regulator [Xylanimonas protaetiae]QAY71191.1 TetR/AcrR family transcriptional regulator [Xylanimonas protaetiae]